MTGAAPEWVDAILGRENSTEAWKQILSILRELAISSNNKTGVLDRATVVPDRLIANSAWNLWDEFQHHAPDGS
jgi:hypothetical protein